jgi:hypothetical protein
VLFDNRIGKFPIDLLSVSGELGVRKSGVLAEFAMSKFYGQATKGTWWMPRRVKAMKDVVSCDKPGRGANNQRPLDFRMGEPGQSITGHCELNI